jgi:DNA-binding HxlR family transcriptional regulator
MARRQKKIALVPPDPTVLDAVENVLGCKWSLTVIDLVRRGVRRPGAMERSVAGLTAKVLNERLRKLVRYGILERHVYPEIPPHVEYRLTPYGKKLAAILERIVTLEPPAARPERPARVSPTAKRAREG